MAAGAEGPQTPGPAGGEMARGQLAVAGSLLFKKTLAPVNKNPD